MTGAVAIKGPSPTIESSVDIESDTSRELLRLLSSIVLIELDYMELDN